VLKLLRGGEAKGVETPGHRVEDSGCISDAEAGIGAEPRVEDDLMPPNVPGHD
jgi:hypothetical protein